MVRQPLTSYRVDEIPRAVLPAVPRRERSGPRVRVRPDLGSDHSRRVVATDEVRRGPNVPRRAARRRAPSCALVALVALVALQSPRSLPGDRRTGRAGGPCGPGVLTPRAPFGPADVPRRSTGTPCGSGSASRSPIVRAHHRLRLDAGVDDADLETPNCTVRTLCDRARSPREPWSRRRPAQRATETNDVPHDRTSPCRSLTAPQKRRPPRHCAKTARRNASFAG